MARFSIKAGTLEGKLLVKEMEASTPEEVRARIEEEGLLPIEIRPKRLSFASGKKSFRREELLTFNQGLLTLLKAGLPLVESLEVLKKGVRVRVLSDALGRVIGDIQAGKPLSEAFRANPSVFPDLYSSTIAAGERTGDLIPSIRSYIELQKRMEALRKKVIAAASYPLILAAASLIVVAFLVTYVVPSFAGVYLEQAAEMPLATVMLLSFSGFFKANLIYLAAVGAACVFILKRFLLTPKGKALLDRVLLTGPGIGGLYKGYAVSKFSRTFGMLLASGIPITEALSMSNGVIDNSLLKDRLAKALAMVREGSTLTEAIGGTGLLPDITMSMFSAGERSSSLQTMLVEIADFHDQDVEHRVGIITSLIEPALMIIMGVVIGAIVLLMYLPIFQIGARIG